MSIADQITRLINAKAAIKQSIVNKGVDVSDSALLDEYPALIDSIEVGGGGADPFYRTMWSAITNNGTRCAYLFYYCSSITSLNLSDFDTSNVTDMSSMFNYCSSLTSLDVSNFNTSKVTNMSYMFGNCRALTSLDVSNFNTSNVTNMSNMFDSCNYLTSLEVSNFDTSNVTNMEKMFGSCYRLASLDVSNFDTSKVTNMSNMFLYCSKLTSIDVSNWDTAKVTSVNYMFSGCESLTSLDCSNWDVSKCTSSTSMTYMLGSSSSSCPALVDFKAPKNISASMNVSYCTALSHDSLMSIINNLITVTSSKTLTLGATNLAKLTADEIAIATNKGWTVK